MDTGGSGWARSGWAQSGKGGEVQPVCTKALGKQSPLLVYPQVGLGQIGSITVFPTIVIISSICLSKDGTTFYSPR